MKRILLLLLPVTLLLTSCDLFNNFGKKVKITDKTSVYYKGDGVTESDAKKLGDWLEKNRGDNKNDLTAQITKDGDAYVVRMPVKEDAYNKDQERYGKIFWFMQSLISDNVFDGKKVKIILTDDKLKDKLAVDDLTKIEVGKDHYVYLMGDKVKEKEAKEIGDSLETAKFFDYTEGSVLLTKDKGKYAIRFFPNEEKSKLDNYDLALSDFKYIISKYVLKDDDMDMYVIDGEFNDVKNVKMTSDDRKAYFDKLIKGESDQTGQYDQTQYQEQQQQTQTDPDQTPVDNNNQ